MSSSFAHTERKDWWWVAPLLTALGLSAFGAYATWAAFQGNHYFYGSYLSPFYSPVLFVNTSVSGAAPLQHAWFGAWPVWWPSWIPASPALLILCFPLSFRATCYYYRKAYYRAYFLTPPGCAVGSMPQKNYRGETQLFLFQNLHRYAFYIAFCFILILAYDAFLSFFRDGKLGVGVGSLVLCMNVALLGSYTLGCHSLRHLVGGKCEQRRLWSCVSCLNKRHMLFAWLSLFWVGFSDLYVRLVSMGMIHDWSTWY